MICNEAYIGFDSPVPLGTQCQESAKDYWAKQLIAGTPFINDLDKIKRFEE